MPPRMSRRAIVPWPINLQGPNTHPDCCNLGSLDPNEPASLRLDIGSMAHPDSSAGRAGTVGPSTAKRWLAPSFVGLLMAALLTGCSSGGAPRSGSSATSQAPKTSTTVAVTPPGSAPPSSTTAAPPMPELAALSPLNGPAGTQVTLSGSAFGSTPGRVTFTPTSGGPGLSAHIVRWADDNIVVVMPAGVPPGPARPDVWNSAGVEAGPAGIGSWPEFTVTEPSPPETTGLSPSSAPTGGRFTIVGTNLGSASGGAVTFCEFCGTGAAINEVASVISWSSSEIVGIVPALQCGTAEVWVTIGTWRGQAGTMNIANCGP